MPSTLSIGASPRELARVRILRPAVTRPNVIDLTAHCRFYSSFWHRSRRRGAGAQAKQYAPGAGEAARSQGSYPGSFTPAAKAPHVVVPAVPEGPPCGPWHRRPRTRRDTSTQDRESARAVSDGAAPRVRAGA